MISKEPPNCFWSVVYKNVHGCFIMIYYVVMSWHVSPPVSIFFLINLKLYWLPCNPWILFLYSKQQEEQALMTSSLRQFKHEQQFEKYERAIIRFHFPDQHVLQAIFRPKETGECSWWQFYYFLCPVLKAVTNLRSVLLDKQVICLVIVVWLKQYFPLSLIHSSHAISFDKLHV